ncbi:diaminopimelate epimerase [Caloranaerobacter azorensis]|uniref:Diaminopimelate epimerase n=1 Tax=Caloranaerobacter azorensis TaxID=116090 RepID=A0A6P1YE70_9FIRM|nr:diaminopimelate epimerase [Caloranaerobacter azorensis]QIB26266.1 diaminopimelate epimerase [Caloranaerobacter azorensis]
MLEFIKMHGLGNDFIIFDGINQDLPDHNELAKKVCDRHFGIGADGMMVVKQSSSSDIKMLFYNADGSQAPMCGNGIRCFAKYVFDEKLVRGKEFEVETLAGIMRPRIISSEEKISFIEVNLGKAYFSSEMIHANTNKEKILNESIKIDGNTFKISAVVVGSVHAVIFVDDLNKIDINVIGRKIENHQLFPNKINVNFCQIIDDTNLQVLTWERGVGQTLACGTGAASAAVVGSILYNTSKKVNVHLLGGTVEIEQRDDEIFMTGPAEVICKGVYYDK